MARALCIGARKARSASLVFVTEAPRLAMADQLSIALRAWPTQDESKQSLPYLIARINEQKGSFVNVTEASLQEEIRAAEAGEAELTANAEDKEAVEDGQDIKAKGDELFKAREEIVKQITAAYNASSHALDLVSLILSKHTPKAVEGTISPFVKASVPMGSIGAEIMQEAPQSEAEKVNENLVGLGWRLQSLERSAGSLLKSASRLEQEMERETTYWKQILAVKENGWSLCRVPGDAHTLGVRFGFAEDFLLLLSKSHSSVAHPEFRDRGLAALRRDAEGNIDFDRGARWHGDKRLRVRLLRQGRPTATNEKPPVPSEGDLPLLQHLLQARNSLFDEELYHELNREARNLINQGVRCIGAAIHFPFPDKNSKVEIDLVSIDEKEEDLEEADSTIPTAIATALRILLSHAHRESLRRRSQPPPPITETPTPRRFYSLLAPILEIIQHDSARKTALTALQHLERAMKSAHLPFSAEQTSSSLNLPTSPSPSRQRATTLVLTHFLNPHHTQFLLHLPTTTPLTLSIRTSIHPPVHGTSFHLSTTTTTNIPSIPHPLHFPTFQKLQRHLFETLALDMRDFLLKKTEEEEGLAEKKEWVVRDSFRAELVRKKKKEGEGGGRERLGVKVDEDGVEVGWMCGGERRSWRWGVGGGAGGSEAMEEKGLMMVLREEVG
ncbi:MAG: hypothetical protein Q9219_003921 [cf. Caloplaca sp. 3 TL-2023]